MRLRVAVGAVVVVVAASGAACSSGDSDGGGAPATSARAEESGPFAVGIVEETFVDDTRTTPANGDTAERPDRTLVTKILYPAEGDATSGTAVEGATPATSRGPFPLVVFSHGLGGSFEVYQALLEAWAAAGYVVAAPEFPLTHAGTPGGLNAADVQGQPGDVSFVVDQIEGPPLADGPLDGLVAADALALAGHSNGAITTLGAVANSCCRDERADAAVVLSGADAPFADGEYDFADTPPTMWVHGTDDEQVSYDGAVAMFNQAEGPKGLLTLDGADHGDFLVEGAVFDGVVEATSDLFDAYLRGEAGAEARLVGFEADGVALEWVGEEGSTVTIPTVPPPETNRQATATPTTDLTAGQLVTVTWEGFLPDGTINIVQCSGDGTGGSAACDLNDAFILQPNPTGEGSTTIDMVVGPVGNGVCDADHPCVLAINDSALSDPDALIYIPLTFAG